MKKSGFLEGAIIATFAIFFTKFIGIIYVIPFYKIVGGTGGALYGYAYNIYNLFLIISSAGIPLAISKLTSEYNALKMDREKKYLFSSAKKVIFIFSLLCFLICFLGADFISNIIVGKATLANTKEDISFVIRCVSFAILVVPMLSISRGYLQGHGFIKDSSFSQVIEQLVRVLTIVVGSYTTLRLLNLGLKNAVGVAVFGAFLGAITAYFYLFLKVSKIRKKDKTDISTLTKKEKKEVIKKIILYSIPFIIIHAANSLYNSTDMILVIRGLNNLNYSPVAIDTISSVFTTWGYKLHMIITSIATGLTISLVPSISKSNAKGDIQSINTIVNKTLKIFLYTALPLAIIMSIFSREVWTIFYGPNEYGPIIFKFSIIVAAFDALYMMMCSTLQGLNKTKLVYIAVFLGLGINLVLDLPLMYLFNNIGIYPYYGAITATLIGCLISFIIPLITLKRKYHINYTETWVRLPKLMISYGSIIILSTLYEFFIKNVTNRFLLIPILGIFGILLLILYYLFNKKELDIVVGNRIANLFKKGKK